MAATYTYAEVPFFDGLFGAERNNYDKVGHFFQGFVPALLAREILIRKAVVNGDFWRNTMVVSICLAFSAFYELIEWWVALATGEDAEAFLGTQGYIWDTQSDMGLALLGAIFLCFYFQHRIISNLRIWLIEPTPRLLKVAGQKNSFLNSVSFFTKEISNNQPNNSGVYGGKGF